MGRRSYLGRLAERSRAGAPGIVPPRLAGRAVTAPPESPEAQLPIDRPRAAAPSTAPNPAPTPASAVPPPSTRPDSVEIQEPRPDAPNPIAPSDPIVEADAGARPFDAVAAGRSE